MSIQNAIDSITPLADVGLALVAILPFAFIGLTVLIGGLAIVLALKKPNDNRKHDSKG